MSIREILDIYDDNRQITGKTNIRGEKLNSNENNLYVFLCIFNSKGKLLIQKRSKIKKYYPSIWDLSVGGAASSKESPYQAIIRETKEELNIDLVLENHKPFFSINVSNFICDYYVCNLDIDIEKIKTNDEIEQIKFVDKQELFSMIDSNEFLPYHKSLINFIFETHKTPNTRMSDTNII